MSTATKVAPLLQLSVNIDPTGISEANIPVRWCVGPELLELMDQWRVVNPFLLIIVRPYRVEGEHDGQEVRLYDSETARYVVPLTQELQYVSFSRPGNNSIFATIVWGNEGEPAWYLKRAMSDDGSAHHLLDRYGNFNTVDRSYRNSVAHGDRTPTYYISNVLYETNDELTVVVPSEMFAKEPPQWLKSYVGKFVGGKAFDQCHFRRRAMFAVPFGVIYFPVAYLLRISQLVLGLAAGWRRMHVRSFLHPITYGIDDVTGDVRGRRDSIWLYDKHRNPLPGYRQVLNPITPLLLALIIFGLGSIHVTRGEHIESLLGLSWWASLAVSLAVHAVPFVLAGVGFVVGAGFTAIAGTPDVERKYKKRQQKADQKHARLEAKRQATEQALEAMVCRSAAREASVDALPKQKQTIRLKLQATKHRACRPFAR